MKRINVRLRIFKKPHFTLTLLPLATVILAVSGSISPATADTTRTCSEYEIVRDRSDNEVPLLPRASIAHCARFYQTEHQYDTEDLPSETSGSERSNTNNSMQIDSTVDTPSGSEAVPEPSTPNQ